MRQGSAAVLLTTAFLCLVPHPAQARLAMEIVYDASGSMWARVEGKERFLVVNKALNAFLEKVPDDVFLALRVYGARQKSSCDDSELVVPFASGNRDAIRAAIKKIKPLGKTPIQKSLLAAAEDLKGQEGTRIIVLVSDGKETCEGDPCETARQLAESEQIQIDVVGFAIANEETRRQLACIATVGSGNYFEAANEDELNTGLSSTMGRQAPPPQPQIGRVLVRADRPQGVQAPTRGLKIDVYEQGNPDVPTKSFQGQNPISVDLPVGVYRVRVILGAEERIVDNVVLEPNSVRNVQVDFPPLEGVLLVNAKSGQTPLGTRVLCSAYPAGKRDGDPVAQQYGSLVMIVPEGNYDLYCTLLGASAPTEQWVNNVAVKPGQKRELDVAFDMGTLTVSTLGPPNVLGTRQTYGIYPAGDPVNRVAWTYAGSPVEIPAGVYDVQVEVGEGAARLVQWLEGVKITPRSPVALTADFRPGELLLQATTAGQNVGNEAKFTAYPPGDRKDSPAGWSYSGLPLQLPAGTYDALVEYQPPQGQALKQWVMGLEVLPGKGTAREVEFASGQILVHVLAGGQDLGREGGYTLYLPGDREKSVAKGENNAPITVPTGSYDVKAESYYHQYYEWREDVVVTKDQGTELTVDFPTGKLQVVVRSGGEDMGNSVTYYVYPQNEKYNHVAFAFSGGTLELVPGIYDVKVTVGPKVEWKRGVFVEASETTSETMEF